MNPRDAFGLAVRIFGLWLFCRSLPYLSSFIDARLYPSSEKTQAASAAMLIYPMIDLTAAAIFLLWTRTVVSWSYGEEVGPKAEPEPASDPDPSMPQP